MPREVAPVQCREALTSLLRFPIHLPRPLSAPLRQVAAACVPVRGNAHDPLPEGTLQRGIQNRHRGERGK